MPWQFVHALSPLADDLHQGLGWTSPHLNPGQEAMHA
jgi:hypothetical protein